VFIRQLAYQTTYDRNVKNKQKEHPKLTHKIYIETGEVKTYDNYGLLNENHKPHELHLIRKIATIKGEPWWARKALVDLGFEKSRGNEWKTVHTIKPNTTAVNKAINLCKHLVKITPIKFMGNKLPTKNDIDNVQIDLESGEVRIAKEKVKFNKGNFECHIVNGVTVSADLTADMTFPLTKTEILKSLHRKRQLCRLNDEYFRTVYDYKYDQDKAGVIKIPGKPDTNVKEDGIDVELK
jgi:hypothetical protein